MSEFAIICMASDLRALVAQLGAALAVATEKEKIRVLADAKAHAEELLAALPHVETILPLVSRDEND